MEIREAVIVIVFIIYKSVCLKGVESQVIICKRKVKGAREKQKRGKKLSRPMRYEKNLEVYVSPQQTELFGDVLFGGKSCFMIITNRFHILQLCDLLCERVDDEKKIKLTSRSVSLFVLCPKEKTNIRFFQINQKRQIFQLSSCKRRFLERIISQYVQK